MSDSFNEADRYTGLTASNYDEKRKKKEGWKISEDIILKLLMGITDKSKGLVVLDVPVGTGRFFDIYKKLSLNVIGIDVSDDMLKMAQKKSKFVDLRKGNILSLPSDINVNILICYGFLHLISIEDIKKVIHSISQTNAEHIIISATVKAGKKQVAKNVKNTSKGLMNRIKQVAIDAYQCLQSEGIVKTTHKIINFPIFAQWLEKQSYPDEHVLIEEFHKNDFIMVKQLFVTEVIRYAETIFLFSRNKINQS
mgnify:CR=1 FL=1